MADENLSFDEDFSCADIARLLADKVTPDFNFKDQLWFIARANDREAKEYLCLLLRTQFNFQPKWDCESFFHNCLQPYSFFDHRPFCILAFPSYAQKIARRALILRDARQRLQNDPSPFPFLQLPFEIRLRVYNYAFANTRNIRLDHHANFAESQAWNCFHLAYDNMVQASKNEFGIDIDTALLLTNRQIFDEAEPILYQTRFIQIGVHLYKGFEFLESLSPRARRNIRAVYISLPYWCICGLGIDHNLQYWSKLCTYMSQNLQLRDLAFNVSQKAVPANFVDEAWVKALIKIRELKRLVQCNFIYQGHTHYYDSESDIETYYDSENDSESEPDPAQVLDSRLQALLRYLRSEMCRFPASRLLTEKDRKWYWYHVGDPRQDLVEK